VKNPLVFAEQNSLSGKIFDVRENAHNIPQCKKGSAVKERISAEKGGIMHEKWPKMPAKRPDFAGFSLGKRIKSAS
jgi:hypothetical protein